MVESAVGKLTGKFFGLVVGMIALFVFYCEVPAHLWKWVVKVFRLKRGLVERTWEICGNPFLVIWDGDGEGRKSCH
jgi:hypothetical protein